MPFNKITYILFAAAALAPVALPAPVANSVQWRQLESAQKSTYTFDHFVHEFNKSYAHGEEELHHRTTFETNLVQIHAHNSAGASWVAGVNQFTDLTPLEMQRFKGLAPRFKTATSGPMLGVSSPLALSMPSNGLPAAVDWRLKNVVSPVKNQAQCGSCWAHSVAESVESAVAIQTGKLLVLSPQELVDCVPDPNQCGGTGGCGGATTELGFAYSMLYGLTTNESYAYNAQTGAQCLLNKGERKPVAGVTGYSKLAANDYDALMTAVATMGPVSISVDASWGAYESGVFSSCNKTSITIDHAVQLVGYGTESGGDYFLVRNSWGEQWGEDGYIKITRANQACGVDSNPLDGNGCKGGAATMKVCGECGILSDSAIPTGGFLF